MKPTTQKLLLATISSCVFLLAINGALFPIFFPGGPPEHYVGERAAPLLGYHLLAFLITAFLMSYLYPLIYRGGAAWKEGLRVGIIMALFVSLPENLHVYASTNISFVKLLLPAVWVTVIWGMAGVVIGLIYRRGPVNSEEFGPRENKKEIHRFQTGGS
jgi:hypothetical protein